MVAGKRMKGGSEPLGRRELVDFWITASLFSILVGGFSAFTVEINGIFVSLTIIEMLSMYLIIDADHDQCYGCSFLTGTRLMKLAI